MLALVSALVLSAPAAPKSPEMTLVNEAQSNGKQRTVTLSVKGARVFFEMAEQGAPARQMLRDADQKKMWIINHEKKELVVVTEEDSKALEARQAQFRAQMKAQIEKLPPAQRARMEATMLGGGQPDTSKVPNFTYEKKGTPPRTVAGYSCDDYAVKRDGQLHGEGCYAAWKAIGMTADEFKSAMMKAMPTSTQAGPMMQAFEAHASAPGVPVERIVYDANGVVLHRTALKSFSKTALPAERFELPKGYTEKTMAAGMMMGPGPMGPMGPKGAAPPPSNAPAKP